MGSKSNNIRKYDFVKQTQPGAENYDSYHRWNTWREENGHRKQYFDDYDATPESPYEHELNTKTVILPEFTGPVPSSIYWTRYSMKADWIEEFIETIGHNELTYMKFTYSPPEQGTNGFDYVYKHMKHFLQGQYGFVVIEMDSNGREHAHGIVVSMDEVRYFKRIKTLKKTGFVQSQILTTVNLYIDYCFKKCAVVTQYFHYKDFTQVLITSEGTLEKKLPKPPVPKPEKLHRSERKLNILDYLSDESDAEST